MKRLIIIGASGHGKVVADIAKKNGYDSICFLDDDESLSLCGEYPVVGTGKDYIDYNCHMFVAIGNAKIRKHLLEQLEDNNKPVVTLIHPDAVIAENVSIGAGTAVMAGAVINPDTKVGKGCIINTCSSLDHDNIIEDYAHISVGAHLAGTVHIGKNTWVGAGVTVSNNIDICNDCIIGAGAAVVKNIKESGTYAGVPAKRMK